jgi:biofilm PGA synthesis N-glycosyltransferase PgaC
MIDVFIGVVQLLNAFVFLYPCVMAYVWIAGALLYYWVRERPFIDPEHPPALPQYPFVSILVPCHNEAENIEETFGQLMELDYPAYEVLGINDGSRTTLRSCSTSLRSVTHGCASCTCGRTRGKPWP